MKRLLLLLCLLLAVAPASAADLNLTLMGVSGGGATYTGPGDIVSGATAWYGLRAYNAAYAATPGLAVNVRRASDNVACDFLVASSGGFGVTTATCNSSTQGGVSFGTFVGSDGTASCTLAGTTGACTGASGTVHVNDVVTGTGLTQPCIVATASNTAPTIEIAGTTTSCGTVGVAETFTFQVAGFVTEAYDQSGNGNHATQATAGQQPQLLPLALKSATLPALLFNAASSQFLAKASGLSLVQPYTFSVVMERTGAFTTEACVISNFDGSEGGTLENWVIANQTRYYAFDTAPVGIATSDSALHAIQAFYSGSSSSAVIDGATTTFTLGTGGTSSGALWIGSRSGGQQFMTGMIGEAGVWPTSIASLHANQSAWYGTP